jgi:hypothetical protein
MNKVMAGIDLHGNNVMVGIVDGEGRRVQHRKLDCDLDQIVKFLAPYRAQLERVAVESTFNWYWLVDGLDAAGFPVVLANPAKMDQYSGIKHADDKNDAYFLAELLRLNILPTGHIYDAAADGAAAQFQKPPPTHDRTGSGAGTAQGDECRSGCPTVHAPG